MGAGRSTVACFTASRDRAIRTRHEMVTNTLNMLAQLVGTKAQHLPKALKKEQIGSLVGAADPKNPVLLGVAAYVAKNSCNGSRAANEFLTDWEEMTTKVGSDGKVIGMAEEIGQTKTDRTQKGETRYCRALRTARARW